MTSVDELRAMTLLQSLSDRQLQQLMDAGEEVRFEPGTYLFRQGDHADHWWVLLDGVIELIGSGEREDVVFGRLDAPGRWAGGFRAWDEGGVYLATGRGATDGRVMRVPAPELRRLSIAWFPLGVHIIDGVFHTARNVEEGARQRSALITLGKIAAGLAHELNNPAAAATRAVDALEGANQGVLRALGMMARSGVSAEQFSALDALRADIRPVTGPVDALAESDREDQLSDWLEDRGFARSWLLAPTLASCGVDVAWCKRAAELVGEEALEPALEWVTSTMNVTSLLSQVKESTRRVSELVAAVKSYSQMDRGAMQRIDITDGLESTLAMLGHRLRDGVTIERDYCQEVPEVEAFAGELNQVWTNLIDNAIDAMDGHGTLRITTRVHAEQVVVEFGDTGHGMPPEVAERAFEAFFTTKEIGKGTGLGLDIARRIVVQRHGGGIEIDSTPEGTVVRVTLPKRPPG